MNKGRTLTLEKSVGNKKEIHLVKYTSSAILDRQCQTKVVDASSERNDQVIIEVRF